MDITLLLSGILGLISMVYPQAGPVVAILEKNLPLLEKAWPVVEAAIAEGSSAFAAATEAAPELTKSIKDLSSHLIVASAKSGAPLPKNPSAVEENVTRSIFGFPHMTFDEEMKWMNDKTADASNSSS